jgi:hypothetical protein
LPCSARFAAAGPSARRRASPGNGEIYGHSPVSLIPGHHAPRKTARGSTVPGGSTNGGSLSVSHLR